MTAPRSGPSPRKSSSPGRRPRRGGKKPGRWRRLLWALLGLLGLSLALPAGALLWWATRPGPVGEPRVALRFTSSESRAAIAERLAAAGVIDSAWLFELYSRFFAPSVSLAPGPHLLPRGVSPRKVLQCLARLPSRPSVRVTLPEGYTHFQMAERLERLGICTAAEFRTKVNDPELLGRLGIQGPNAEGYLFPATYELFVNAEPEQLVSQLVSETRKRLGRLDDSSDRALSRLRETRGWGEREVLILASVVERESAAPDERPRIASVFLNRLDDPAFRPARRLQSDPTAAYGCLVQAETIPSCAGFKGRVTPEMVRDRENPYNTYRHAGLPPGPIANPGEASVMAVLRPERTDFLYFVLGPDGRHRFGRSFDEHRRAIEAGAEGSLSSGQTKR